MLKNDYGRYLQSHELMPLLGFKRGGHLPPQGFAPRTVNGVQFKCDPATAPHRSSWGHLIGSSKHRIHYHCDACNKWVPFGRAGQHNKGREHKRNNGESK